MTQATVKITAAGFNPNPVVVGFVEIVGEPAPQCQITWQNTTTVVQDATSSDGGQTFTTGPIQPGQSSLPITFSFSSQFLREIPYSSTASGLTGTVSIVDQFIKLSPEPFPVKL